MPQQHTKYQQNIIKNYYKNRDSISLQRLQELVTELYLTTGKKRSQHWKTIIGHLEKLGVKQDTIDHLVKEDKPELILGIVETFLKKQG
jgi:hypothetical protein